MILEVGKTLFAQIDKPDYGPTFFTVVENNGNCSCGKNDKHTLIIEFNWDVGLDKETEHYTMPYNQRGKEIKVCGKDLEEEIRTKKIRLLSEKEQQQRRENYDKAVGDE